MNQGRMEGRPDSLLSTLSRSDSRLSCCSVTSRVGGVVETKLYVPDYGTHHTHGDALFHVQRKLEYSTEADERLEERLAKRRTRRLGAGNPSSPISERRPPPHFVTPVTPRKPREGTYKKPATGPQTLAVDVVPQFCARVGESNGLVTLEGIVGYLRKAGLRYPEERLGSMFAEADYKAQGALTTTDLRAVLVGRFRHRSHTEDWRELVRIVTERPSLFVKPADGSLPPRPQVGKVDRAALSGEWVGLVDALHEMREEAAAAAAEEEENGASALRRFELDDGGDDDILTTWGPKTLKQDRGERLVNDRMGPTVPLLPDGGAPAPVRRVSFGCQQQFGALSAAILKNGPPPTAAMARRTQSARPLQPGEVAPTPMQLAAARKPLAAWERSYAAAQARAQPPRFDVTHKRTDTQKLRTMTLRDQSGFFGKYTMKGTSQDPAKLRADFDEPVDTAFNLNHRTLRATDLNSVLGAQTDLRPISATEREVTVQLMQDARRMETKRERARNGPTVAAPGENRPCPGTSRSMVRPASVVAQARATVTGPRPMTS